MEITPATARGISRSAWVMAVVGTVVGQVHALARAQAHPQDFEESPLARAWGEPATRALRPLLDWSDPWTVYVTYGKVWLPVCLAFTAAALLVYRRRQPRGAERRLWQLVLGAYAAMTVSVFGDYFTPWMDQGFVLGIAAMLVIGLGGPALGLVLLRNGFRPRVTPVLLVLFIPLALAITTVTSLGSALLPLIWGWALAAHAVAARPGAPGGRPPGRPPAPAVRGRTTTDGPTAGEPRSRSRRQGHDAGGGVSQRPRTLPSGSRK